MTAKHVVADEVLGKVAKRFWELMRRIMEGAVDPGRALYLLQLSLEGVSKDPDKTYVLESGWAWDHSHREYASICFEDYESEISFEDILNPSIPEEEKKFLLSQIKDIFDGQVPKHGSYNMVRVYRVLNNPYPNKHVDNDGSVDLHFVLKPIFDFDSNGKPVPCSSE